MWFLNDFVYDKMNLIIIISCAGPQLPITNNLDLCFNHVKYAIIFNVIIKYKKKERPFYFLESRVQYFDLCLV